MVVRSGCDGAWPCMHVATQGVRSGCDGAWPCMHVAAKVVRSGCDDAWPCMHVNAKVARSGCDGARPSMHVARRSGCEGAWPCTLSRVGGSRSSDTLRNEQTWELRSTTYLRYYLLPLEGRCCSERCKLRGGTLHGWARHPIAKLPQS